MPEANEIVLPDKIVGYLSVRGKDPKSILLHDDLSNLDQFRAEQATRERAEAEIAEKGFDILTRSDFGFAVAGSGDAWQTLGDMQLTTFEQGLYTRVGQVKSVTQIAFDGRVGPVTARIPTGSDLGELFDAVVIERPRSVQEDPPSATPPSAPRFHLRVPEDVATILGAREAHERGFKGKDVTVAMVDTGWWKHPFFKPYTVLEPETVIPGTDVKEDPHGHGTGESANLFAVAPEATLLPIRAANDKGDFVGGLAGFMLAKQRLLERGGPVVISNSWGGDYPSYPRVPGLPHPADRMLEIEIRDAIAKGIVVVFAAGNGSFGMEAQVPGVIAAGGVYADVGWALQASEYASAYSSPWYTDATGKPITVPTVCGLVGQPPRASYLMLPIAPRCRIDTERATAGRDDPADGTTASDGWALFSGTSAAAPQVAGAVAVLRSIKPDKKPAEIARALSDSALDIRVGHSHPRFGAEAGDGHDLATGAGLINVVAAVDRIDPPEPEPPLTPRGVVGTTPDGLAAVLSREGLMERFLELLATDDQFRADLEKNAAAALAGIGVKGPVDLREKIELAPKRLCASALRDFKDGEPFDVGNETVRVTSMLS
ncbi:S8 family serine peptidase [Solirubrobacter soli]|uniref:S8 family serine peptidase n=1 Tax=Solirubrobacter soli TaxID=363832 RepID=UPI000424C2E3|nr:S8 family serine peptidase [Solirubrobacter soli]